MINKPCFDWLSWATKAMCPPWLTQISFPQKWKRPDHSKCSPHNVRSDNKLATEMGYKNTGQPPIVFTKLQCYDQRYIWNLFIPEIYGLSEVKCSNSWRCGHFLDGRSSQWGKWSRRAMNEGRKCQDGDKSFPSPFLCIPRDGLRMSGEDADIHVHVPI